MNPNEVLIWACVGVFVCTAVITLLFIVNLVSIPEGYRNKLFAVLIIEIVVVGVITFKNSINDPLKTNFIRITSPSGTNISLGNDSTLYVNGICINKDNALFHGEVVLQNKVYRLGHFSLDTRNLFSARTIVPSDLSNAKALIRVRLEENGKILFSDSTTATITTN